SVWGLVVAALCVALNGFFVAAEFALVKVRATQLRSRARKGDRKAIIAETIVGRLDRYLSVTQFGITLASLGLGWIGEPAVAAVLDRAVVPRPGGPPPPRPADRGRSDRLRDPDLRARASGRARPEARRHPAVRGHGAGRGDPPPGRLSHVLSRVVAPRALVRAHLAGGGPLARRRQRRGPFQSGRDPLDPRGERGAVAPGARPYRALRASHALLAADRAPLDGAARRCGIAADPDRGHRGRRVRPVAPVFAHLVDERTLARRPGRVPLREGLSPPRGRPGAPRS